ncbi:unnamed protein product [Lactuca saligna]|uniref:Uncharacterized protein n=1 Tax=Lactuca saligna TaxID=75948 RepID=A0AA35VNQ4_LACSI|nr:unnamed protein product [Lactuca saligna]
MSAKLFSNKCPQICEARHLIITPHLFSWCCWSQADGDKEDDLYNHTPTAGLQGDGDDDDGDNDHAPAASEGDSDDDDGDYDYAPAGLDGNGADDDDYCEYALAA